MARFSQMTFQPVRSGLAEGLGFAAEQITRRGQEQREQERQDALLAEQREKQLIDKMISVGLDPNAKPVAAGGDQLIGGYAPSRETLIAEQIKKNRDVDFINKMQVGLANQGMMIDTSDIFTPGTDPKQAFLMKMNKITSDKKNAERLIAQNESDRKVAQGAAKQYDNPQLYRAVTLSDKPLEVLANYQTSQSADPNVNAFQEDLKSVIDLVNSGNKSALSSIDKMASDQRYSTLLQQDSNAALFRSLRSRASVGAAQRRSVGFTDMANVLLGTGKTSFTPKEAEAIKVVQTRINNMDKMSPTESKAYAGYVNLAESIDRAKTRITADPGWDDNFGLAKSMWEDLKGKFGVSNPAYVRTRTMVENMISNVYDISGKQLSDKEITLVMRAFIPTVKDPAKNYLKISETLSMIYRDKAKDIVKRAREQDRYFNAEEQAIETQKIINSARNNLAAGRPVLGEADDNDIVIDSNGNFQ